MEQPEEWDGQERRSPEERRARKKRRVAFDARKRLIGAADGADYQVIPDALWDRRSNQDRRGHPFYTLRKD
jgi:hypothetical protein